MAESECITFLQSLAEKDGTLEAPINISLDSTKQIALPKLVWNHYDDKPKKMKITNTGHTVILSAKWEGQRPFISAGPLLGNFVFSQLHFHWGSDDTQGSEHTIDGESLPFEMHAVHFKENYGSQEEALKKRDGMVVVSFFYTLQPCPNPWMQVIIDSLSYVEKAHTSARILPVRLSKFFKAFDSDYFLYWGSVLTNHCSHPMLWIMNRNTMGISTKQLDVFRNVKDADEKCLVNNFRPPNCLVNRTVFHVNPSDNSSTTLL